MDATMPSALRGRSRAREDNAVVAVADLLELLGKPVAPAGLRRRLRTHPQYPNLPALIDTLDEAGVGAQAVGGEVDELADVTLPAIAHFGEGSGGRFVVLTEVRPDALRYLDPAAGWVQASPAEFAARWSGVLLLAEPRVGADDRPALAARRAERLEAVRAPLLVGLGTVTLLALVLFGLPSAPADGGLWLMLAALKGVGLVASALLVALDPRHPVGGLQRLCPAGRVVDCASVLDSPAAKLGGWVPMADLGAIYFLGGIIVLSAARWSSEPGAALALLAALTLVTLPYSVFSVVYQAAVLRRWCWLCLVVMALFWAEAAAIALASPLSWRALLDAAPAAWALAAVAFVLPGMVWGLVKPAFVRGLTAEAQTDELLRHRRHPLVLEQAMAKQRPTAIDAIEPEITFGSETAPLHLVVVSHPFCAVCQEVHPRVEKLVAEFRGAVRCTVRFGYRRSDPGREIARRTLAIALTAGPQRAADALSAWYGDPSQGEARWLDRFALAGSPPEARIDAAFEAHLAWVESSGLDGVPAVFLDGRMLPREFGLDELRGLLRVQARALRQRAAS